MSTDPAFIQAVKRDAANGALRELPDFSHPLPKTRNTSERPSDLTPSQTPNKQKLALIARKTSQALLRLLVQDKRAMKVKIEREINTYSETQVRRIMDLVLQLRKETGLDDQG